MTHTRDLALIDTFEPETASAKRLAGRESRAIAPEIDLVVADASWTWTERLFTQFANLGVRVLLVKACDWLNAIHQRRPRADWLWQREQLGPRTWTQQAILPPGWMKSYPRLGMIPLARAIRAWHKSLDRPRPLALAVSYPHYLFLNEMIRPEVLLYYNMDDYAFYWSARRRAIRRLERRLVGEADLSVFCARSRAIDLARQVPEASPRIVHLPHGAPADAITAAPLDHPAPAPADLARLPGPRLGFVGSLEDRVDWNLIGRLADEMPDASVVLIGREPKRDPRATWHRDYLRAVERPNVHRLGWKSQAEIGAYSAAFDVCLIPYLTDHPFNRASCPTKVMDYMATTRPVVSTALHECRLYADLFDVAETPDEFVAAVRTIIAAGSNDGRAPARWAKARASTWNHMAAKLYAELGARIAPESEC